MEFGVTYELEKNETAGEQVTGSGLNASTKSSTKLSTNIR